jgi:Tat protein translocase TatB subunit
MLPGGIGFWEIMVVLVVVLLVMGPAKIPEVARTLGKGVRAARRAGQELRDAIDPDEYKRQFRSWEMNHQIDDVQVAEESDCPEDQEVRTPSEIETPVGPMGTIARSDSLSSVSEPVDEGDAETPKPEGDHSDGA